MRAGRSISPARCAPRAYFYTDWQRLTAFVDGSYQFRDSKGDYLVGGRTYSETLPGPIPAKQFWSFTVYDNQARSPPPTDQKLAGLGNDVPGVKMNPDGGAAIVAGVDGTWSPEGPSVVHGTRRGSCGLLHSAAPSGPGAVANALILPLLI